VEIARVASYTEGVVGDMLEEAEVIIQRNDLERMFMAEKIDYYGECVRPGREREWVSHHLLIATSGGWFFSVFI